MSCRTETTNINGREISVTQWSVETAALRQLRLLEIFGSPLATIMGQVMEQDAMKNPKSGKKEEASLLSAGVGSFGVGIQQLFKNANPKDLMSFIKECIIDVAIDGTKVTSSTFQTVFTVDSLMEMYQVFWFVIKVNYGNFIPGSLLDAIKMKLPGL